MADEVVATLLIVGIPAALLSSLVYRGLRARRGDLHEDRGIEDGPYPQAHHYARWGSIRKRHYVPEPLLNPERHLGED